MSWNSAYLSRLSLEPNDPSISLDRAPCSIVYGSPTVKAGPLTRLSRRFNSNAAYLMSRRGELVTPAVAVTSQYHRIGLREGDELCVVVAVLPCERGSAVELDENPGAPGFHATNGSVVIIIPSWRIIMEGKRMLT